MDVTVSRLPRVSEVLCVRVKSVTIPIRRAAGGRAGEHGMTSPWTARVLSTQSGQSVSPALPLGTCTPILERRAF